MPKPSNSLIDQAVALAEAETDVRGGRSLIPLVRDTVKTRHRPWTPEEDAYLTENYFKMSRNLIAKKLGRSEVATKIHSERELKLGAPTKGPEILTGEHVAMGLGLDGKSVHLLMDRGLMPCHRLGEGRGRSIRCINRKDFNAWLLKPEHWCYFKPRRVGKKTKRGKRGYTPVYDAQYWKDQRRQLLRAFRKWSKTDAWLTPIQAAKAIGLKASRGGGHNINAAINAGNLKATRWGNWWIRKSDLPKGLKFNAKGHLVKKIWPQGRNPKQLDIIKRWWKGKKRLWPGGPAKGIQRRRKA
jgi:hypothetical protein